MVYVLFLKENYVVNLLEKKIDLKDANKILHWPAVGYEELRACCSNFSFMCMFCRSLFVLLSYLAFVLSVLRFTDSDYPLWYLQTLPRQNLKTVPICNVQNTRYPIFLQPPTTPPPNENKQTNRDKYKTKTNNFNGRWSLTAFIKYNICISPCFKMWFIFINNLHNVSVNRITTCIWTISYHWKLNCSTLTC